MANRAYLYVGTNDSPPEKHDEQVLGANYLVPVLWLACLNQGELKHIVLSAKDEEEVYYFSLRTDEALRRCENRSTALRACISNIDDYLPAWLDLLSTLKGKYIKIDPSEVLWMEETAKSDLERSLTFLDSPTNESALAFMQITCLNDVYVAETKEVHNSPGKTISELLGRKASSRDDRRSADFQAREYMTGYTIAGWIPWEPLGERKSAPPARRGNLTSFQRLSWHPLPPIIILLFTLYVTWPAKATLFNIAGFAVIMAWLSLSVYDYVSKGKFTSWLYSED